MTIIFTYNRIDMLTNTLKEVREAWPDEKILVIDDGSDTPWADFQFISELFKAEILQFEHCGKQGFYKLWDYALHRCEESKDEYFTFLPDDYSQIDFERITDTRHTLTMLRNYNWAFKIVNDGRGPQWTTFKEQGYSNDLTLINWLDCSFHCNRSALFAVGYYIDQIPAGRFVREGISSGVGEQLTRRFNKAGVPIYRPIKSMAFHGDHESIMHGKERVVNPLTSK
jgi:hypothetical protein